MRGFLIVLLALPPCVHAQRADDNAVKSAGDAFGNSVGTENIGSLQRPRSARFQRVLP
jgi:hypothetical protein